MDLLTILSFATSFLFIIVFALVGFFIYYAQTVRGEHKTFLPTKMAQEPVNPTDLDWKVVFKDGFYRGNFHSIIKKLDYEAIVMQINALRQKHQFELPADYYVYATRATADNLNRLLTTREPTEETKVLVTAGFLFRNLPIPPKLYHLDVFTIYIYLHLAADMYITGSLMEKYKDQLKMFENVASPLSFKIKTLKGTDKNNLLADIILLQREVHTYAGLMPSKRSWPFIQEFEKGLLYWIEESVEPMTREIYAEIITAIALVEDIGIPNSFVKINANTAALYDFISNELNNENN